MSKYAPHGRSTNRPRATPTTICQKCLGTGHFIYECKSARPYVSRPSRTQQLDNPKLLAKLKATGKPSVEVPEEFKKKNGTANKILELKEKERLKEAEEKEKEKDEGPSRKRARRASSDSESSSESDSSDSDSDSSSGSSSGSESESSRSRERYRKRRVPRRGRSSSRSGSRSRSRSVSLDGSDGSRRRGR